MSPTQSPRVVVLGLDGLSLSQARYISKSFDLPNLSHLVDSSSCREIEAEIPALSPVNWTSLYTAAGPEEHGIFGFTEIDPLSYEITIVNSSMVKKRWIFHEISTYPGVISKIINLPNTYPAHPLKGILIAGFIAPDLKRAVYPPPILPLLKDINYLLETDTTRGRRDPDYLFTSLSASLESRKRALEMFWGDLAWNVFILVLTETDRLNHFFFTSTCDPSDVHHEMCRDFFIMWDRLIGEVLERFSALPSPKKLMVVADHGFCSLKTEVDLNVYLKEMGLLRVSSSPSHELDASVIQPETRAFSLDGGRIYIHDKRFSRGHLTPADKKILCRELITDLKDLVFKGKRVFEDVVEGEELYPGCDLDNRPDIVCIPTRGIDVRAKFDTTSLFSSGERTGCHTHRDVFFYHQGIQSEINRLRDVGREILTTFKDKILL